MIGSQYRAVLAAPAVRRLLPAVAVSDLGDAMSAVTIAWLALQIGPRQHIGLYVGLAVAAYGLPSVVGTFAFARPMQRVSPRVQVALDSALHAVLLGCVAALALSGELGAATYPVLLALSALLAAWGSAGRFTLIGDVAPPEQQLSVNALLSTITSASVVLGPALAGVLLSPLGAGWLIAADAASFAWLGVQVWFDPSARTSPDAAAAGTADRPAEPVPAPDPPADAWAGLRIIRAQHLIGLLVLTWFFEFLYGPVEVALPVHVARDLHAGAGTLGAYWSLFGVGAVLGSLLTTALRRLPLWPTSLAIAAGWGLCLLPFGLGAPTAVTMACFGVGGLIYGPFVPLTYLLFQRSAPPAARSTVLAAHNALVLPAAPLGTALGGPLVSVLGATGTLALSGGATVAMTAVAALARPRRWLARRATARPTPPRPGRAG